ncbi:MAG: GNAT family N-acetyltransferase [Anaerolineae bacterium]|nr:GNAT family N-acetyltransferase [Anaerolineae bacterium]
MVGLGAEVVPYARRFRRDLLSLVDDPAVWLHVHLDWHSVEEWIVHPEVPIYLALQARRVVGAIAATPPLSGAAWLRLIALRTHSPSDEAAADIFATLWRALRLRLVALGCAELAALALHDWVSDLLAAHGFAHIEDIITMRRRSVEVPESPRPDVYVRHAHTYEAETAAAIDRAAFLPLWALDESAVRQAARSAASFTIAEERGRAVGYQISTLHGESIHLARLAVLPEAQGSGIGGTLLSELLSSFVKRGILAASVNTQASNVRSQRLYERYGFTRSGLDIPCWRIMLA